MSRHVDWEILVHLDSVAANELGPKDDYFKAIEDRYAANYCVALGVQPLPHHKAAVSRLAPLGECKFDTGWSDSSAVCSTLAITQPSISGGRGSPKAQVSLSAAERNAEWFGQAGYMNVLPPDPPLEIAAHYNLAAESKAKAQSAQRLMRARSVASMQLQDLANSTKMVHGLTDELERNRLKIRGDIEDMQGKADVFGKLLKQKGRRESDEIELENLKYKFLLPFACQRPGSSKLLPWQSPDLRKLPNMHVHEDFLEEAKLPIMLTVEQMETECFNYAVTRFPVELLTTRADVELFAAIREQLVTEESVRLIGLLAHFVYWIVLDHIHEPSKRLPEQSKQSMVLTIQELWSLIQAPARQRLGRRGELLSKDGPAGISFVIPNFMLALKRGVEWVFTVSHPWIFKNPKTSTHLIDQINVMFMRFFDPDCLYASFGALEASGKAIALWHKLGVVQASLGMTAARNIINQEFRTTPLMTLLMTSDGGNPGDPKTRVLLAKCASESMIGSPQQAIGSPERSPERVPLEGWRRAALFRSANKRVSGLQRAGSEAVAVKEVGSPEQAKRPAFMKSKSSIHISPGKKNRSGTHTHSTHTRSSERTSTVGSESATTMNAML